MRPVRVNKSAVLTALYQNRKTHREIFEEALEGYRKEAISQLENHITELKSGKPKRTYFSIPFPEDHTDDYDDAIEMLEMSVDDTIDLDAETFKAFYKDDWGWKNQFLMSNSGYSRTAYAAFHSTDDERGF